MTGLRGERLNLSPLAALKCLFCLFVLLGRGFEKRGVQLLKDTRADEGKSFSVSEFFERDWIWGNCSITNVKSKFLGSKASAAVCLPPLALDRGYVTSGCGIYSNSTPHLVIARRLHRYEKFKSLHVSVVKKLKISARICNSRLWFWIRHRSCVVINGSLVRKLIGLSCSHVWVFSRCSDFLLSSNNMHVLAN